MIDTRTLRGRRPWIAVALGAVAALVLAGCSSGAADPAGTADKGDTRAGAGAAVAPTRGGADRGGGGVSGLIASVSDGVMQVQGTDVQTAVTWTDQTVITRTVVAGLEQVTVGACVAALGAATADQSTGTADAAEGPATSVAVSQPTDGECSAGFGRMGAGPGSGQLPTDLPTDFPTDFPTDMPTDGTLGGGMPGGFGGFTAGLVTAVSGTTITVEGTDADGAATTETIEVDADTTYLATVASDASAIAVGLCASAQGETDTRGGMAATSLVLSDAGESGCSRGAGMAFGAPGGRSDG